MGRFVNLLYCHYMETVNLHTHFRLPEKGIIGLKNHQVQFNFDPEPGQYYSVGLHPWSVDESKIEKMTGITEKLAAEPSVLAIGECGLDRSIEIPAAIQQKAFLRQIDIAEKYDKPLILHAVKTYSDLLQLKKARLCNTPWILHGYQGNEETTKQLIRHGFFFSFGKVILDDRENLNKSLRAVPRERLFFETDESVVPIESIYIFAASLLEMGPEELRSAVRSNFRHVFGV